MVSATEPASPTISNCGQAPSRVRRPIRVTWWSSTISKRIVFVSVRLIRVPLGNGDKNMAALARGRDHLQVGANFPRPGRHVAQTVSGAADRARIEADPVVANLQADAGASRAEGTQ